MIPAFLSSDTLRSMRLPLQVALVVGIVTALVTLFIPNEYRSDARILPADVRGSAMGTGLAAAAAAVGVAIPGQESADAAYVDILNSRWLREGLLTTRYRFHQQSWLLGRTSLREQTLFEVMDVKNMDRAVKKLKRYMSIQRDLKTKLITISMETESPELTQQVVQRAVVLLEEFVVKKTQSRGSNKAAFSEKRLGEARKAMTEAEDDMRVFMETNRNWQSSTDPSIRLKGNRLENELRLRMQLVTTLAIAREQALLEEKNDMPILNVLDSGNLPEEKSGPARSQICLVAAILAGLGVLLWMRREQVLAWLGSGNGGGPPEPARSTGSA